MARGKKNTTAQADIEADEAEQLRMVEAVEAARAEARESALTATTKTLAGDLRDMILTKLRVEQDKRPWSERSDSEQRDVIAQTEAYCEEFVGRLVSLIAASGQPVISAHVEGVNFTDDKIKASLSIRRDDELRHAFADAQGSRVVIIVADPAAFLGEKAPVKINRQQADIEDTLVVHSSDDDDDAADRTERDGVAASPLH